MMVTARRMVLGDSGTGRAGPAPPSRGEADRPTEDVGRCIFTLCRRAVWSIILCKEGLVQWVS